MCGGSETKMQGEQDPRMVAKRQRGLEVKEPVVKWLGSNQRCWRKENLAKSCAEGFRTGCGMPAMVSP